MATYSNDTKFDGTFQKALLPLIRGRDCTEFIVAVGYVGVPILKKIESNLLAIAKRGECRIIIGMIYHEGCTQSTKSYLEQLDSRLRKVNSSSGIFVTRFSYHGKVYKIVNNSSTSVFIGSSNFSSASWTSRAEFNLKVDEPQLKTRTLAFISHIESHNDTIELSNHSLKVKSKGSKKISISRDLKDYIVPSAIYNALPKPVGQFDHILRVDENPKSGLNLYFGPGRLISGTNKYAPRPWNEIELSANATEYNSPYYPKSKPVPGRSTTSKARTGEFVAFINDGQKVYKIDMKVHADNGKNISSADTSGGRATLGKYIKGKLQDAGVLTEGELVTSQTLVDYGRDTITFFKIDDSTYIIDFDT